MPDPSPLFVISLIVAVVWVIQFASFMVLDDKSFPGRSDKLIWGAAFIFAFPVAPFAFLVWKSALKSYVAAERQSDGRSVSDGSV
jgi:hypothetical protein